MNTVLRARTFKSIQSEAELATTALALAGPTAAPTPLERSLTSESAVPSDELVSSLARRIASGEDPLGDSFLSLRSQVKRRQDGAVYTPTSIVDAMLGWAERRGSPATVVDPGAGSGRFVLAAAERFPEARLVAVEKDPLAALLLRANAQVRGVQDRLELIVADYREARIEASAGSTLFIGNPPYVRHHQIDPFWKEWLSRAAADFGLRASKLAGLHVHFFVRTAQLARRGDMGVFVTSAEWLDVNYGEVLKALLTGWLGVSTLHVLDSTALPFDGTYTTAVITGFEVGSRNAYMLVKQVEGPSQLGELGGGRVMSRAEARPTARWSEFLTPSRRGGPQSIRLGDLFRVHRGQVTGANRVWIAGLFPGPLPEEFLFPTVTRARELIATAPELRESSHLRRVIDLPVELGNLEDERAEQIQRFLDWAREHGADRGYVARHRAAWWSVGLREPAPILVTYMARRAPVFVLNKAGARHINIAHGLYPRVPMDEATLGAVVRWLNNFVSVRDGRTYAGGLTKFEPRELERLHLPTLEELDARAAQMVIGGTAARRQ